MREDSRKVPARPTRTRRLTIVAGGNHFIPYVRLGDAELPVSPATKPDGTFGYNFDYATLFGAALRSYDNAVLCPCAGVVTA